MPAGAQRQRFCLQVARLAKSGSGDGVDDEDDQALRPENQRQGRAVHLAEGFCEAVDAVGGVGLRDALERLNGGK